MTNSKRSRIVRCILSAAAVTAVISCALRIPAASAVRADTYEPVGDSVTLNLSDGKFVKSELESLFAKMTANEAENYKSLAEYVGSKTATDEYTRDKALNATEISENAGKSFQVVLDGKNWAPVYLSQDINGDVILTLWVTDYLTNGVYCENLGTGGRDFGPNVSDDYDYPLNMYSTSTARSQLMGTPYSADGVTLTEGAQASVWSDFLGEYGDFIDSPSEVGWQSDENSAGATTAQLNYSVYEYNDTPGKYYISSYNDDELPENPESRSYVYTKYTDMNEATGRFDGEYFSRKTWTTSYDKPIITDYTSKESYFDWASDKLWLPSATEVGSPKRLENYYHNTYSSTQHGHTGGYKQYHVSYWENHGIWELPRDLYAAVCEHDAWLRTGYNENYYQVYHMLNEQQFYSTWDIDSLYPDGYIFGEEFSYYDTFAKTFGRDGASTGNNRGVQPAIHLNLSKAYATVCTHNSDPSLWGSGVVTAEPTYKEEGVTTYTCTECGARRTETVGKLQNCPHEHVRHEVSKVPTEREDGEYTHVCEDCGYTYTERIPPFKCLEHEWDGGVVTVEPQEGVAGVKTFTCDKCGETRTETIAALPAEKSEASAALGGEEIAAIALGVFDAALIVGAVAGVLKYFYVKKV